VVAETHVLGIGRLGPAVAAARERPELALAQQLRAACIGPRATIDRAGWIVGCARAARAVAVVLWLTREDEALAWHVPSQRKALGAAGLPTLVLPAARWQLDERAIDRLTGFLEENRNEAT
jgi:hypothetical protein